MKQYPKDFMLQRWDGDKCVLCGGPADFIVLYVPPDDRQISPDIHAFFRYCLCTTCRGIGNVAQLVEGVLHADA